ncbi:sulfurtransferase [Myxacorys almedinensis]|uniref:Sulfurtransferase n=1 Tax=Myxacorys almedinensis A TaxID=2690445 RepID=A0A8J8CJG0_9CYAN|nr:sulfurtransferase [Myxacorys almedinensis]NDJ17571.1 sulfurtransferase [Myxacorys almedinensis A]
MAHPSPVPPSPIVSAAWLRENLAQVVVIDSRFALMEPALGRQQYEAGHILGAYYADLNQDLSSPVQQHGGRHPLPDLQRLSVKLSAMGITASTVVVAYDDSRFAFAARLWWLLRYLGHDHAAVLDGGFKAWQAIGGEVSLDNPKEKSGNFNPTPRQDWVVDIDTVNAKKDLPAVALIDSREPDRYRGDREPIDPIAGHIPGALNYPWHDVTTEQGYVISEAQLRDRWSGLVTQDLLVYCGSGVTACVNLLSLAAIGLEGKLYAGSWSDWCSYHE